MCEGKNKKRSPFVCPARDGPPVLSHLHGDNSIAGEQRARTEKKEKVFPWDIAEGGGEKNRKKALRRERGRKFVRSPLWLYLPTANYTGEKLPWYEWGTEHPSQIRSPWSAFVFVRAEKNVHFSTVRWAPLPSLATQSTIQPWAQGEKKTQEGRDARGRRHIR